MTTNCSDFYYFCLKHDIEIIYFLFLQIENTRKWNKYELLWPFDEKKKNKCNIDAPPLIQ